MKTIKNLKSIIHRKPLKLTFLLATVAKHLIFVKWWTFESPFYKEHLKTYELTKEVKKSAEMKENFILLCALVKAFNILMIKNIRSFYFLCVKIINHCNSLQTLLVELFKFYYLFCLHNHFKIT